MTLTGLHRPARTDAPYWRLDDLRGRGVTTVDFTTYGPLLAAPGVLSGGRVSAGPSGWLASADLSTLTTGRLSRSTLLIVAFQLVLPARCALLLVARLLSAERASEVRLLPALSADRPGGAVPGGARGGVRTVAVGPAHPTSGHHHRHRHPRPGGRRQGPPHGRHPRRPATRRWSPASTRCSTAPAASSSRRVHRGPGYARPRGPGTGAGPHRRTTGRQRMITCRNQTVRGKEPARVTTGR